MVDNEKIERILRLYPDECRAEAIHPVASPHSFSGAGLWRVQSRRGPLCLRCWPPKHPSQERLEFIQAVLWHVDQEGFHQVPLPLETRHRHGYVWHESHLWELTPWLPGAADYRENPSRQRLHAALAALAHFHAAATTFPLPESGPAPSPGLVERRDKLRRLAAGQCGALAEAVRGGGGRPELATRARQVLDAFGVLAPRILDRLESASRLRVALQPCIRDVWHAHVLFDGDTVSGLVDFGSMRADNVATDIARLLGSMALDNHDDWQAGLAAYRTIRRISDDELALVDAFDRSTVLMGGLQWLEWLYLEGREFPHPGAVLARLDEFVTRLDTLVRSGG
jgi:Ser/Thr protein kinase RdoA (MazF antagonist)